MHSQAAACSEVATVRKHLSFTFESVVSDFPVAGAAELADALDSKSEVSHRGGFTVARCCRLTFLRDPADEYPPASANISDFFR